MLARGKMLMGNCSGFLWETVRWKTQDMKIQGCLTCQILGSNPCLLYKTIWYSVECMLFSLGFILVSHSSSLLWGTFCTDCTGHLCFLLLFVGCLHRNLICICTLGPCEVVVAGNWECEIAYLQTCSLAWVAKGNSKHIRFFPAVFFSLFLSSWAWKLLLSV